MTKLKITFHHPPVSKLINPLENFHPWLEEFYPPENEQGIYIYGIRAKVGERIKFIPLVVGQSGDLLKRLYQDHYLGKFATPLDRLLGKKVKASGDAKEIWDFSGNDFELADIKDIYNDALSYDTKPPRGTSKVKHVAKLDKLIFFQDADFFHEKTGIAKLPGKTDLKIEESIYYLMFLSSLSKPNELDSTSQCITRIISTLINFKSNFYYVYASTTNNSKDLNKYLSNKEHRENLEYEIKEKLRLIGIHTTAKARKSKTPIKINLDLSKVQDELVNVGSHATMI